MKKVIIIAFIAITAFLFWSPWMGEDGGENVIRKVQAQEDVKAELEQLGAKYGYSVETGKDCDGLSTKWAPFGRVIQYCEYDSWYVTFWGQRF